MQTTMVGRGSEMHRLRDSIVGATHGRGGALLLLGAPGSGRSRLLLEGREHGSSLGMQARHAAGRAGERRISSAVVNELLGVHEQDPPAVLDRLVALASLTPMVVTVDDVHLADEQSIECLMYCARRLLHHPIMLLMAASAASVGSTDGVFDDVERLVLDGLTDPDVMALFEQTAGRLSASAIQRVRELTGGNPLAVIELARQSSAPQRAGEAPFDDLPAVSDALIRSFAEPLIALPQPTRRALCLAAAEPSGRLDIIGRALARLGDDLSSLEAAEVAGVYVIGDAVDGVRVGRFDHPMRRVVAYASLAAPSRRSAHRALAHAWSDAVDGERRMRHLVAATLGPDNGIAADLAMLASHFEREGRWSSAAVAWEHAATLSTTAAERQQRSAAADAARRRVTADAPATGRLASLSRAELRVARVVAEGATNRQAAERLFLSNKTVDSHLQTIFRKLDVNTRAHLAVLVALHDAGSPA